MIKVHVAPGEEVVAVVQAAVDDAGISDGAVTLIGALDSCRISNMPANDAKSDNLVELHAPLELSGTGEISEGKVHLHVVLSSETNVALAGHLHWGRVETWFVNAYIHPLG